jgi:long-chain fatty acid transport protein
MGKGRRVMPGCVVRPIAGLASALAVTFTSSLTYAAGFYIQEQSARGVGRAFSGEAADTGPASLWWNPAAIGGAPVVSAYLGDAGILASSKVSDAGTLIIRPGQPPMPVGGDPVANGPIQSGDVPSGALAVPVSRKLALGLAITAPFDFTTKYDSQSWARYSALRSQLRTYDIQPSIAFAPSDALRLGVALNVERSDATLTNALPNLSPLLPDGLEELRGGGWDLGWSAGVQAVSGRFTFGVAYKSSIRHGLDGNLAASGLLGPLQPFNTALSAQASFRTPWQVVVGARAKASDRLTLDLQVTRLGWGEFDAIRLGAPVNASLPQDYHDTWSIAGGLDYAIGPRWTVRAGIQYDETPTTDGQRDARVPDSDRIDFAAGASYQASARFALDAGVMYADFQGASIDRPTAAFVGTPVQTPIITSGRVADAHAVVLALGARLSF